MASKPPFSPVPTQRILTSYVSGVAATSTAYINLPLGFRYRGLHLLYGGTTFTPANMTAIRLYADNDLFQVISGSQRDMLNQFDKLPAASTYKNLHIPFERLGMSEPDARYLTCINTGAHSKGAQSKSGITAQFRMEVDINSGAVAPTLSVLADVMDVNVTQSRLLPRIDQWTENVAATGEWLHVNSNRFLGDSIRPYVQRLTFGDTNTNITNLRLRRNNEDIVNVPTTLLQYNQVRENRRAPQANFVSYDTGDMGEYYNILDPIHMSAFEIRTTHAATNASLPVISETMGPSTD